MKLAIPGAIYLALLAATTPVNAQSAGDPNVGLAVAQQVCSVCHATQKGQDISPNSKAPTFAELAATPGMTGAALMVALTTPHAGMPMFTLTSEEKDNIIAYIVSLGQ